jgi:hypothetical protein
MYAEWSPTGAGLAYVFSNNIFYRSAPTAEDVIITESGKKKSCQIMSVCITI